jgi:hypothetical protein
MAESEEDPELRAIYWQEYVDYKTGKRSERKTAEPESDDASSGQEQEDDAEEDAGDSGGKDGDEGG